MEAHIGLGGPPDLLSMRVLPALQPLYDAGVFIRIRPGTAEQLLKQLEDHTLDMFIATRQINSETTPVIFEPLFDEEYVLVGDRAWHARIQDALEPGDTREEIELKTVAALAGAPFLAFDATLTVIRDHPLVSKHRNAIFAEDRLKQVPLIMPDFRALREVAITGSGVTVIPRYIVQDALREERLFELYDPSTAATTRSSSPTATSRAAISPSSSSPRCGRARRSGRSAPASSRDGRAEAPGSGSAARASDQLGASSALLAQRDHRLHERADRAVVRARDHVAVDDDVGLHDVGARVHHVVAHADVGARPAAAHDAGRDHDPRPVAEARDDLAALVHLRTNARTRGPGGRDRVPRGRR